MKIRTRVRKIITAGVLGGMLIGSGNFLYAQGQAVQNYIEELKLYSKALGALLEGYVGDVEPRRMFYEAVRGMMNALDQYSEFIDPEKYELMKISIAGEYAGIGTWIKDVDGMIVIDKIRPQTAADRAGLLAGDKILAVDGVMTQGKGAPEIGALLRGEPETMVVLLIQRDETEKVFEVELKRETISVDALRDVRIVGKSIGYFALVNWQENTVQQVEEKVDELLGMGMQALIIDLRGNQGGLMTQAVALSDHFLPEGMPVVEVRSKIDVQQQLYKASGGVKKYDFPLVILVNQASASASEIFSACMQDHGRATLVGMKTFGKASVQSVIPLDEKSAMKLTTARYYSPKGRMIDSQGITPDIVVEQGTEDNPQEQLQIKAAIKILEKYY